MRTTRLDAYRFATQQRGMASLAATLLFILGMSVGLFYFNRGLIFEQKSAANQVRSTQALEIAEAGLEWVIGKLNDPDEDTYGCIAAGATSFKRRYVQPLWASTTPPGNFDTYYDDVTATTPVTNAYPGCKINGSVLSCSCPASTALTVHTTAGNQQGFLKQAAATVSSPGSANLPTFSVAFEPVRVNSTSTVFEGESVRVTVTGCTQTTGNCVPGNAGFGTPDATATVSAIIRFRPGLRAAPAAALTCGGSCSPGGSYNIVNTDPSTNGVTINAGLGITNGPGVNVYSMPGVPATNSQLANDNSLAAISSSDPTCANSSMFKTYFGVTLSQYSADPTTKVIDGCSQANTCGGLVHTAYNQGWRNFYFPDGFALNNSAPFTSLGSVADPVNLVTPTTFDINGNISIYGVVFTNDANTNDFGTGAANIYGGVVTCRNQASNGNGTIAYNADVMRAARRSAGTAVRVSGSWTDACRVSTTTNPPTRNCAGND